MFILFLSQGLRLLPAHVSQGINLAVENALQDTNSNPFRFEREYAHVLSGEEEALYAWLTVNYLLGGFNNFQYVFTCDIWVCTYSQSERIFNNKYLCDGTNSCKHGRQHNTKFSV